LRGGGGNFGIATAFEYRLHPIGPLVTGGMALYPVARATEALHFMRDVMASASDELTLIVVFITAPPAPFLPEPLHGQPMVALVLCHAGPLDEGQRAVEQIRAFGPPAADMLGPLPYTAQQRIVDDGVPFGRPVYLRSDHLRVLSDEAIETIVAHAANVTSALSVVAVYPYGGAVSRVGEHETAFGYRGTAYDIVIFSIWTDPRESERHIQWRQDFGVAMRIFSQGVYVNELGVEGEDRVREAYNSRSYARLVALKNQWDPTNVFRLNQNIKPTV
jgi:FAD/FMN-containing dehydrogenase